MNVRITLVALVLGVAAVLSSAGNASAFFGHHGGCGCDSCDDGCGHRCCLFNLFHKHNDCCCEETCGCEASCGCASSSCGCDGGDSSAPAEEAAPEESASARMVPPLPMADPNASVGQQRNVVRTSFTR